MKLDPRSLYAMSLLASSDGRRYSLATVAVYDRKKPIIVATDSYVLGVLGGKEAPITLVRRAKALSALEVEHPTFMIPADAIAKIVRFVEDKEPVDIKGGQGGQNLIVEGTFKAFRKNGTFGNVTFDLDIGFPRTYPAFGKLLEETPEAPQAATWNPKFLARFSKVIDRLGGSDGITYYGSKGPKSPAHWGALTPSGTLIAILMPIGGIEPGTRWLKG